MRLRLHRNHKVSIHDFHVVKSRIIIATSGRHAPSLAQLLNAMSIHEIDRTSTLDQEKDRAVVREDADAEEPGPGGDGEHEQKPAEQGVESDEAEEEDQAPAAAPQTFVTAANAKKTFGMKRSNPTVKKGVKTASNPIPLVSHQFLTRQ